MVASTNSSENLEKFNEHMGSGLMEKLLTILDGIDARSEAATHGPWVHHIPYNTNNHAVQTNDGGDIAVDYEGVWYLEEDAEFISHARTELPKLSAALREVLKLHPRRTHFDGNLDYCPKCIDDEGAWYPCSTVRAIAAQMGELSP